MITGNGNELRNGKGKGMTRESTGNERKMTGN
jgi:hypothetical protein